MTEQDSKRLARERREEVILLRAAAHDQRRRAYHSLRWARRERRKDPYERARAIIECKRALREMRARLAKAEALERSTSLAADVAE